MERESQTFDYGHRKRKMFWMASILLLCFVLFNPRCSQAFNIKLSDDASINWDTTISYGASWRMEDQDSELLANINGDDGNRSFDKWDMINNRFKIISEADLKYKNCGIFVRGRAFYDDAYMDSNAHDSPLTHNNGPIYGGPLKDHQDFMDETEDRNGKDVELLDAFFYMTMSPGGRHIDIRVGRQVISWGESLFIQGGVSTAQSPADVTAAQVPGVELRDLFMPVGQVYASIEAFPNFTVAGYYQWEWEENRIDEAGAYFSAADFMFQGGRRFLMPFPFPTPLGVLYPVSVDRLQTQYADDSGQYGVALRYMSNWLNDAEFGLYYLNYHEKMPIVQSQPFGGWPNPITPPLPGLPGLFDNSSYYFEYPEDIKLYGFSMSTSLADVSLGLELTYRKDLPVAAVGSPLAAPLGGFYYVDADAIQVQMNGIYKCIGRFIADAWTFQAAVGYHEVNNYGSATLKGDDDAWGCSIKIQPDWWNLIAFLPELEVSLPLSAKINPSGVAGPFKERADSYNATVNFTYRNVYQLGIGYTMFTGKPEWNALTDRDFLGVSLKYTF